jgi:hypothetical protein
LFYKKRFTQNLKIKQEKYLEKRMKFILYLINRNKL